MLNATFQIENFTYNNTSILEVLFGYLEKTQFRGITVSLIKYCSQLVINTHHIETNKHFPKTVAVHVFVSACST